jgi:hypothetical protein
MWADSFIIGESCATVSHPTPRALDPRKIAEDRQVGACAIYKQFSRFEFILLPGMVHAHPPAMLRERQPLGTSEMHYPRRIVI